MLEARETEREEKSSENSSSSSCFVLVSFRSGEGNEISCDALQGSKAHNNLQLEYFSSIFGCCVLTAHYALDWSLMNAFGKKAFARIPTSRTIFLREVWGTKRIFPAFHSLKNLRGKNSEQERMRSRERERNREREKNCGWMTWQSSALLQLFVVLPHIDFWPSHRHRFSCFFCWLLAYVMHPRWQH